MPYFVATLCSPIALLMVQRPWAAALNAIVYGAACIMIVVAGLRSSLLPGILIWAVAFSHAYILIKASRRHERNDRLERWDYFKFS